jgi:hypothetical protein
MILPTSPLNNSMIDGTLAVRSYLQSPKQPNKTCQKRLGVHARTRLALLACCEMTGKKLLALDLSSHPGCR